MRTLIDNLILKLFNYRFKKKLEAVLLNPNDTEKLIDILEFIDVKYFSGYRSEDGLKILLSLHHTRVNDLIIEIERNFFLANSDKYINNVTKRETKEVLRLDDFLADQSDRTINIKDALEVMRIKYLLFCETIMAKSPNARDYYKRRTQHLEEDMVEFIKAISTLIK